MAGLGLGCSRLGSFGSGLSRAESIRLVRQALDAGVNLFDTANIYGQGDSERYIGAALSGRRHEAFIVTKVGKTFSLPMQMLRPLKPVLKPVFAAFGRGQAVTARREAHMGEAFRPAAIRAAVDASLARLRTDMVDGLLLHSPSAHCASDPAMHDALASVKSQGKALRIGMSCDDAASLEAALLMPGLELLELPPDLISLVASVPVLSERIRSTGTSIIAREVLKYGPALTPREAVQRALAWPHVTCVVVGTSRLDHLKELMPGSDSGIN